MSVDYFKNLVTGYLKVNELDLNSVEYEKLNGMVCVTIHNDSKSKNAYTVLDTIQYINNILNQLNFPAAHMQNVYRDDYVHWLEDTYVEFTIDSYNQLNEQLSKSLNINN